MQKQGTLLRVGQGEGVGQGGMDDCTVALGSIELTCD